MTRHGGHVCHRVVGDLNDAGVAYDFYAPKPIMFFLHPILVVLLATGVGWAIKEPKSRD